MWPVPGAFVSHVGQKSIPVPPYICVGFIYYIVVIDIIALMGLLVAGVAPWGIHRALIGLYHILVI
jgi:hypothetical protein